MKIEIYLDNEWRSKPNLHYDLETETYFMVINSKKYNRNLKKIIHNAKKVIKKKVRFEFVINNKLKYLSGNN